MLILRRGNLFCGCTKQQFCNMWKWEIAMFRCVSVRVQCTHDAFNTFRHFFNGQWTCIHQQLHRIMVYSFRFTFPTIRLHGCTAHFIPGCVCVCVHCAMCMWVSDGSHHESFRFNTLQLLCGVDGRRKREEKTKMGVRERERERETLMDRHSRTDTAKPLSV